MCYKISGVLKIGCLKMGVLPNTAKIPVNCNLFLEEDYYVQKTDLPASLFCCDYRLC